MSASLFEWSACQTNNQEVATTNPGNFTIINWIGFGTRSTQPREDYWIAI